MSEEAIRLDKWLWAARFFKTRTLAKTAIEGGKIRYQGERIKASRTVQLNAVVTIRQGLITKTILITGLSDKRGNADLAAKLYAETLISQQQRTEQVAQHKAQRGGFSSEGRPSKRDRRRIVRFKDAAVAKNS